MAIAAHGLASASAVRADLSGTVTDLHGTQAIMVASAWQPGKLAANEYLGPTLIRRYCADGERFWFGDFRTKTYTTVGYGQGSNDGTGGSAKTPTQAFVGSAKGQVAFLARLYEDLFGGATPRLPIWLTNIRRTYVGLDNMGDMIDWQTDPVFPDRQYTPSKTRFFVMEYQGRPVMKSMVWEFRAVWNEESAVYLNVELGAVHYAERVGTGRTGELRQWTLQLTRETELFSEPTFTFTPPNDWRATALPARGDGG